MDGATIKRAPLLLAAAGIVLFVLTAAPAVRAGERGSLRAPQRRKPAAAVNARNGVSATDEEVLTDFGPRLMPWIDDPQMLETRPLLRQSRVSESDAPPLRPSAPGHNHVWVLDREPAESTVEPRTSQEWHPTDQPAAARHEIRRIEMPSPVEPEGVARVRRFDLEIIETSADAPVPAQAPATEWESRYAPVIAPIPDAGAGAANDRAVVDYQGDAHYWIVGTRHSDEPELGSCLQYYRVDCSQRIHLGDQEQFLGALEPGVPVCIVIHGGFVNWETAVMGAEPLYCWLTNAAPGQRVQFVFFTWPSDTPTALLLPVDFAILARRSAVQGVHLSRLISQISPNHPVSMMAHSLGARMVASAMHLRARGEVQGYRIPHPADYGRRIRIVFVAAAIDAHWLNPGERYGNALCETEYLVNLTNRDDSALNYYAYRRMFSNEALATTGFTPSTLRALGHQAYKLGEIDVTPLIRRGHLWHHYVNRPQIAQAIAPVLFFSDGAAMEQPVGSPGADAVSQSR